MRQRICNGLHHALAALAAAAMLAPQVADADIVTDWHDTAMTTFAQTGTPLLPATRALALTHAAIHDAINAVDQRYAPFAVRVDVRPPASADAAASAAARRVLVALFPARTKELDAAFRAAIVALPEGAARERGIELDPGVLTWLPLVDTPLHPEYPCAHCIVAGAVATVLEAEFGAAPRGGLSMTSPTAPGVTRRWERFADIVDEISNARVWAGIHFRNSTRVGEQMGRAIGAYAMEHHLRPVLADGKAAR